MEKKLIDDMKLYLDELRKIETIQGAKLGTLDGCDEYRLRTRSNKSGRLYYYAVRKGESTGKYLGDDSKAEVNRIKEHRYYTRSLSAIRNNISVIENSLEGMQSTDYASINNVLPDVYKNVRLGQNYVRNDSALVWKEKAEALKQRYEIYRPDELSIMTNDGSLVRSKSEAIIYNYLLSRGVTFVYELPLKLGRSTFYPDFTLLSEKDYKSEIIIEHQGLMSNDYYRGRFSDKLYRYLQDGYIQGINIFYTFDGLDGSFDISPIDNLVRTSVKPFSNEL